MSNKKNGFILGSALSFAGLGALWYEQGRVTEQHAEERMEAVATAEQEVLEYLESVPTLLDDVSERLLAKQQELADMQNLLGQKCLAAMLDQTEPQTFDQALEGPACSEYSASQLENARRFYSVVDSEVGRLQDALEVLTDDPSSQSDPLDILIKYAGVAEEQQNGDRVDVPVYSTTLPDSAKIVKKSGDSYLVGNIDDPKLIKQKETSNWFVFGMFVTGMGALFCLGNLASATLLRQTLKFKHRLNSHKNYRQDLRRLQEVDEDSLGLAVNGLAAQLKDED